MKTTLQLDSARRSVTVGERSTVLHERSWQVLQLILESAPNVVARDEFIDTIWRGNALVGEKGLNQAIWSIRAALGDDPRQPQFVRTIPRVGYQWVGPVPNVVMPKAVEVASDGGQSKVRASAHTTALIGIRERRITAAMADGKLNFTAAIAATALIAATFSAFNPFAEPNVQAAPGETDLVATSARLVGRDVHVRFREGCLGILKNASDGDLGAPVLSSDGTKVAFPVFRASSCRLVTVDLNTRQKQSYAECPVDRI